MYPIDLAPQKITIVKNISNSEVKMAHLIAGQTKTTAASQILSHSGSVSLMRPTAQILSPGVAAQPQMIVSGSPLLQGTHIVSQGTQAQLIGQSSQIISQSQIISPSGQILSPGTQIISQGTQLSAQVSSSNIQVSVPSSVTGQVLSVGGLVSQGQLVGGTGNLVVSSSVRTLPPSVRVLPPLPHHSTRPGLSTVNVNNTGGVLVSKGVQSHVPRGPAAGASLAVRPVTPTSSLNTQAAWPVGGRCRGGLLYSGPLPPRVPRVPCATAACTPTPPTVSLTPVPPVQHSAIVTLPNTTVITSSSVIAGTLRASTPSPRATPPPPIAPSSPAAPRPLPLLQRNYQPKMVGVSSVGVRGVGNSAPTQLYYEVPRGTPPPPTTPQAATQTRLLAPYPHVQPAQVSVVSGVQTLSLAEARPLNTVPPAVAVQPRPTILRKRDAEESPLKSCQPYGREGTGWEGVPAGGGGGGGGSGGSTTISAASSPTPDEPDPPRQEDVSPRKKPRKQMLTNEVRQCQEYQAEEAPPTPPPVDIKPPKRPQLSSAYVCGWRSTALHFVRPADVKRREPRAKDIVAIASQKHVLTSAEGWKVHHLTAQMDDLVSLEADVSSQLSNLLRTLECTGGKALAALQPHSHTLMELLKGNIQRSKIVCESIQEAREDVLRVFTHRNFVSDILTRQADKRCFRKHRSQS